MTVQTKFLLRLALAFLFLGSIGFLFFQKYQNKKASNVAPNITASKEIKVTGFVVKKTTYNQQVETNGTLVAGEFIEIKSEISGRVVQQFLSDGVDVQKGALLVKLFDGDLRAQFNKFSTQLLLAEANENRLRNLLVIKGISQQEYDNALGEVNNLKADMELVRVNMTKTEVRAPFAGRLGLRMVSDGAYVTPAVVMSNLFQNRTLKLDFSVAEKFINKFKKGQNVTFFIDAESQAHQATISAIEPQIDLATRTQKIRAMVNNSKNIFSAGTFVRVSLNAAAPENAILIPSQAIIPEARNKKVMLLKNGKCVAQIVEVGERESDKVQIIKGLSEGDTIAVSGIMQLKPEMAVKLSQIIE